MSSSRRKVLVSTLALLRGGLRSHHPHGSLLSPRVSARRFLSSSGPRFPSPSSFPTKFIRVSYSSASDVGGASACWNCGAPAGPAGPFLSCGRCRSVQPVDDSVDYFQIFGLERVYDIRVDNLEGKYKDWQKKLHPDLVHSKSEKEKAFAAEQSARVIDAFHTLSKPLSRALYLLQLEGVHVDEEKTVEDPDLLAEMMEIREEVEEANSSEALNQIQAKIQRKLEACSNSFLEAFKKRDFEDAVTSTQRMRYYERAIEAIGEKR